MTQEEQHLDDEQQDDAIIATATKWSLVVLVGVGIVVGTVVFLLRAKPEQAEVIERGTIAAPENLNQTVAQMPAVSFTDITASSGISFVHESGARGQKLLPETMGGGAAFLDYDNDGDQDLFFVNSMAWPHEKNPPKATMALYRNDGTGHFEDVTGDSGLGLSLYGMGVACGDFDNDGWVDLFLSALGKNVLLQNQQGRFVDVTDTAGVAGGDNDWSTGTGFFDFDRDGDLDLFVCNYVAWSQSLDLELDFSINGTDRAYGPPKLYPGTFSYLYRNEGNGSFSDVSKTAGIQVTNPATGQPMGKSLAVTFPDIDRDGFPDILVANDTVQNFLFQNRGDGSFAEIGTDSGVAFDNMGTATGAMGMDTAYFDDKLSVGIGNFANESTSFYVQQRGNPFTFADMSAPRGIGSPSRLKLSFGLFFFDYDLDGYTDMLQANGHLETEINHIQPSQRYRQPAQLFWNQGGRGLRFSAVPESEVGDLSRPIVGRGATYADIDGDGDPDVLLVQTGGPPMLLRNDQQTGHHWLQVKLTGTAANRDAIGSTVTLKTAQGTQRQQVMPTCSYLSQTCLTLNFGLGTATAVESLTITWTDGTTQDVQVPAIDQLITVTQEDKP